jgi:cobalt transporter subunit CbtA
LAALKRIIYAAALAGLLAGLLLTLIQVMQVSPIIHQAEVHEHKAASSSHLNAASSHTAHDHHANSHHEAAHAHEERHPENGWERTGFTALANISQAVGFGLFLGAAFCLRKAVVDWRSGLLWGIAGYAIFFIAPSLGLPPELPGTNAAPLLDRQIWWVMMVLATAAGLALMCFSTRWKLKLAGLALLVVPHFLGAPHPAIEGSTAPMQLTQDFLYATAIANAVFWLALGSLMGFFYKRIA